MPCRRVLAISVTSSLLLVAGCRELDYPAGPGISGNNQPAGYIQNVNVVDTDWQLVTSQPVDAGSRVTVEGSRYTLNFDQWSLSTNLTVTIKERDPGIVDVDLGPEGSTFYDPVRLDIDYRGTEFDRSLPGYTGKQPKLFWFNASTRAWVLVPGEDDPEKSVYSVKLQHFSRYAMGEGTSGWETAEDGRDKDAIK